VLRGGATGTITGLVGGIAGVLAASRRYHTVQALTLPMKAFLVTSTSTFCGIIAADHASRAFESQRNRDTQYLESRENQIRRQELAQMTIANRAKLFFREEKYKIIGVTWAASMVGAFVLVGRNPYLTAQQKIVQARVYAQGLTLAVLCASAAFEIHDQRKGQGLLETTKSGIKAKKEANQPAHREQYAGEDLWKDMVAAEEEKLRQHHQPVYAHQESEKKDQRESSH
jgi:hypothetical protein